MSLVLQVLLLGLLPGPARAWPQEPEAAEAGATTVSIAEALRSGGLEGARTGLAEAVDALVQPRPSEESQQIDLLLELDRFALELQEFPQLLRVRQAIFDLQTRLLPPRHVRLHVVGFDWNCPQNITPRHTEAEVETYAASLGNGDAR